MTIQDLMKQAGTNMTVFKAIVKSNHILSTHDNIVVSVSGGSDSDVVIDLIYKVSTILDKPVKYVWFDTGLEYSATRQHLKFLEEKYGITIIRERAAKPIPVTCKEYGQPFLSKMVSSYIHGLQRSNFKFEDKPYEELVLEYPNIKSYISWWCNKRDTKDFGYSIFNINYNKYLKEFLVANPPNFLIGSKCCKYAKKDVSKYLIKKYDCDLMITGIRSAEGGIRSVRYKTCFSDNGLNCDTFRPIFWFEDKDKQFYVKQFDIVHSDCYTKYGMRRTGCAGCPYNRNLAADLQVIGMYEPNLYKAVNNIFGESYIYTQKYKEFCKMMKAQETGQMKIFDI